jgi:hypothetical protein
VTKKEQPKTTWRPPTRRAFVQMLGAAAAALALRDRREQVEQRSKPIWIGHY